MPRRHVLPGIAGAPFAVSSYAETRGGKCGDNLKWKLEDGTLTISGKGRMYDYYFYPAYAPWDSDRDSIKTVNIREGVTGIGSFAFYLCSNLESITIPQGVTSLGDMAFYLCYSLKSIKIPSSVRSVGNSAFYGCGFENIKLP